MGKKQRQQREGEGEEKAGQRGNMQAMNSPLMEEKKPSRALLTMFAILYVIFLAFNALSQSGKFGPTNADVSKRFPTPITPAGWAFSIWGIIFLFQGCGVLYAVTNADEGGSNAKQTGSEKAVAIRKIAWRWMVTWTLCCLWQVCFAQESEAGMVVASCLLVFASSFMNAASILSKVNAQKTWKQYISLSLPSSIFAGWLTVATCIQIVVVFVAFEVGEKAIFGVSIFLLFVFFTISMLQVLYVRDYFWSLPSVWALIGVLTGQHQDSHNDNLIKHLCLIGAIIVSLSGLYTLGRNEVWPRMSRKSGRHSFVVGNHDTVREERLLEKIDEEERDAT